jgi:TROVE domain
MSKFNRDGSRRWESPAFTATHKITTVGDIGDLVTHEGAPALARDRKSELFQLAVVNMVGEDTFYEAASERDERYRQLVQSVAVEDPVWLLHLISWLRNTANMRSASVVAAAEMARAWQGNVADALYNASKTSHWDEFDRGPLRLAVDAALTRADEPGEMLAYWKGRGYGPVPKAMKRGIADAVRRLYTQRTAHKWDKQDATFRFADVIELTHPKPVTRGRTRPEAQSELFKYLIDERHNRHLDVADHSSLTMLAATKEAMAKMRAAKSADEVMVVLATIDDTALTWENVLSLAGGSVEKGQLWDAVIPQMGYMVLLRNLRNFDRAGISPESVALVQATLTNRDEVRRSRQFPYRFLSAYLSVDSDRWREPLSIALAYSTQNIPVLQGRTLVLVDTSASMQQRVTGRSQVTPVMAGGLFGTALAAAGADVDLYGFANGDRPFRHPVPVGASVLKRAEAFTQRIGEDGHGTMIAKSIKKTFNHHARVIVITDMQTFGRDHYTIGNVTEAVPATTPLYAFNLGGYRPTPLDTRVTNRYELGGLTDATFRMIPLLEQGESTGWPWEVDA